MAENKYTLKFFNKNYPNDQDLGYYIRNNSELFKEIVKVAEYPNDKDLGAKFRHNLLMLESISNLNINSWE